MGEVGLRVGRIDGVNEGAIEGLPDGADGSIVGDNEGVPVGRAVGEVGLEVVGTTVGVQEVCTTLSTSNRRPVSYPQQSFDSTNYKTFPLFRPAPTIEMPCITEYPYVTVVGTLIPLKVIEFRLG